MIFFKLAYLFLFLMSLKVIIFDVDGAFSETKHDGYLKGFNKVFN